MRTAAGWCTATSSPRTSCSATAAPYLIDFGFASAPSITPDDATARDAKLAIGTP
jgi:hypothetical protein